MTGPALTLVTRSNKEVAVRAVSFYVDRFVTGRISKFAYGTPSSALYKPSNPEHVKRKHKSYLDPEGDKYIPDHFNTMLPQVCHSPPFIASLRQPHYITGY
jgi:hypothetical protein